MKGGKLSAGYSDQNCASNVLNGTFVGTDPFPWEFEVVNERAERERPGFPFEHSLQISDADARILYNRFGRRLYAIVSYRFLAANNRERKIQIVPTDGQIFGLSSDSVVRVKSFAHPAISQASYLDITNPLKLRIREYKMEMELEFQQRNFRAVGKGARKVAGTDITSGREYQVSGSAAVGNSVFVMRLATSDLPDSINNSGIQPNSEKYLTLFGSVDFEKLTETKAPVSGQAYLSQVDTVNGKLFNSSPNYFSGAFRPAHASENAELSTPESRIDTSPILPDQMEQSVVTE